MDPDNPVVKLCLAGMQAEAAGDFEQATRHFQQAWLASSDDYEACIAAHYLARHQEHPEDSLRWNQEALDRAAAVGDDRIKGFYPSLYLNMGYSYELLGQIDRARSNYTLAAERVGKLPSGHYANVVRDGAARGLARTRTTIE